MSKQVSLNEWVDGLSQLRDARALILRDAESFYTAATTLEYIGQILSGQIRTGLGSYESELLTLASSTGRHERAEVARLFKVVRESRNMAVHEGAWARHLNSRLIDLFLILEEAIMAKMTRVEDIMVRSPVAVEPWQMVAHARKTMLANSFSCLPIFSCDKWQLLCDTSVMRFLRAAANDKEHRKRLATQLDSAIADKSVVLVPADCCPPHATVDKLLKIMTSLPVLVVQEVDGKPRLAGIVTPFDLL